MDRLIFSRGSPNSLYVAVDTWANLVATYQNANYDGCEFFCSDGAKFKVRNVGGVLIPQTVVYSGTFAAKPSFATYPDYTPIRFTDVGVNGSDWHVISGVAKMRLHRVLHARMTSSFVAIGSGTISTGSSGHLTLSAALNMVHSEGCWCYIPATVTCTPNIAAGVYWCEFSTTRICTIRTSGPGSAAFNFSAGGALAGDSANVYRTMLSTTIPGGCLGDNGGIDMVLCASSNGGAGIKGFHVDLGATTLGLSSIASNLSLYNTIPIFRNLSSSKQVSIPRMGNSGVVSTIANYGSEDTSTDKTITVSIAKNTATDWVDTNVVELYIIGD